MSAATQVELRMIGFIQGKEACPSDPAFSSIRQHTPSVYERSFLVPDDRRDKRHTALILGERV